MVEFDHFRKEAGLPTFTLSVSGWIEKTGAIGLVSKAGRYGGTYAHKDIAFEFCGAISPVFKLYLIKEYQRLKEQESSPLLEDWKVKRILSKVNYEIHTDAVRDFIVPQLMEESQIKFAYTSEADMLNLALFHYTAKQRHSLTEMFQYPQNWSYLVTFSPRLKNRETDKLGFSHIVILRRSRRIWKPKNLFVNQFVIDSSLRSE